MKSRANPATSAREFSHSIRCICELRVNWVNRTPAGLLDGVTMVAGHEYAESVTDPGYPSGWLDRYGAENGDKCSTYGNTVTFSTGTFPVQATWSNYHRYDLGAGCVFGW